MKVYVELPKETIYPCIKVYDNKEYGCITYMLFTSPGAGVLLSTTSDELEPGELLSYSTTYKEDRFTPVATGTIITIEV